jgi:hypothetical protein
VQMFDFLATGPYVPFTVCLTIMAMFAALELIGLGLTTVVQSLGFESSLSVDTDGDGIPDTGSLTLFGVGKVPLGILVTGFLFVFGCGGVLAQRALLAHNGHEGGAWLVALALLVPALLANGVLASAISRVLPQDETTAVSVDDLLGRWATMQGSQAEAAAAARAEVYDIHGQSHYVMVLPHEDYGVLRPAERVLLVRREGTYFRATPERGPLDY